jgi:hypothetical protein
MSFSREANVYVDEYGIDPLNDKGLTAVSNVTRYSIYNINQNHAGRPELISYTFYKTVDLWWAILAYNGISDVRLLTVGTNIRIPDFNELMTRLSQTNYIPSDSTSSSVAI